MKIKPVILLTLLYLSHDLHAQAPAFVADSLDGYIKRGMADWKIPGLAIAIVQNGKVVLARGYGVRDVEKGESVDKNTLFEIASNTKLFTASAVALLADQKKIDLDGRVTTYLPSFALYDSASTALVTVRDLLSHRMGTKDYQGDFAAWDTDISRQDVVDRMRLLKPVYPFRQTFGYSNGGYVTAGEIIPKVSGQSWEAFVEQKMVRPLQMNNTFMLTKGIEKRPNVALPYTTCCNEEGKVIRIPFDNLDNLGPSASMISSVEDMSHWLIMQLDSGRYEGKQVLPWSVVKETREPNTIMSTQRMTLFPLAFQVYCLGIGQLDYAGHSVFVHRGGSFGYHTVISLVPETKLGIVVMMNLDNSNFHQALQFQLLDAYFGVPYADRSAYYLRGARKREAKNQQELKSMTGRVAAGTKPPVPLMNFVGTYRNAYYGTMTIQPGLITKGRKELVARFQHHPDLTARMEYMDGNEFRLSFSNPRFGQFPISFTQSGDAVSQIEIKGTEFVDDDSYRFERVMP